MQHNELTTKLASSVMSGGTTMAEIQKTYSPALVSQVALTLDKQGWTQKVDGKRIALDHQRKVRALDLELVKALDAADPHRFKPTQHCFTALVSAHLDGCETGSYPSAVASATIVAGENAQKLLRKRSASRLAKAINENTAHPAMLRVRSVADQSAMSSAKAGTVSNLLGTLASLHRSAVKLDALTHANTVLTEQNTALRSELYNLRARYAIENQKNDWKTNALLIRSQEPEISNRKLATRVGKSEGAIRKLLLPNTAALST